jgi:multiple sugar transport system substrate-binding protein
VTLISGCAARSAPAEPVTLDFAAPETRPEYWEGVLAPFREAHPNITVNVQPAWNEETDVILADVFQWEDAMQDGRALSLDAFVEGDPEFGAEDFPAGALGLFAADGKQWAIPFDTNAIVMYYNKDLFDAAGLAYPQPGWTWDDFLAAAQAIRDPDAGVYGYLSQHSRPQSIDPLLFILTHGANPFDAAADPDATEAVRLDDPSIVEAVTFWADLMFRHNVAPTQDQLSEELASGLEGELLAKQRGKVAMWMDWYTARTDVEGLLRNRQRWGITTVPADERVSTFALGRGLVIDADAPDPQAAWQLVSFLSRQPSEEGLPARRSVAESESYVRGVGEETARVAAAVLEDTVLISPSLVRSSPLVDRLLHALNRIADGRATVMKALTTGD